MEKSKHHIFVWQALEPMESPRESVKKRVHSLFTQQDILRIDKFANFFGLRSRGRGQVRGNGVLALSGSSLCFRMFLPKRELQIPLADITGVETPLSFLSKGIGRPLLEVKFAAPDGCEDAAAWYVRDLPEWKRLLAGTMSTGHLKNPSREKP